MDRTIQRSRYRRAIPRGLACRGRLLQKSQYSVAEFLAIYRHGSRSGRVAQSGQAVFGEALPPFNNRIGTSVTAMSNLFDPFAIQTAQDNLSSFDHLLRFRSTP